MIVFAKRHQFALFLPTSVLVTMALQQDFISFAVIEVVKQSKMLCLRLQVNRRKITNVLGIVDKTDLHQQN
jgi:hypothetical protein